MEERVKTHYQKEFADDNFKFDENGRKLSKWVENSPFPTVFSKGLFPRGVKRCHCVGMGFKKKEKVSGKEKNGIYQWFFLSYYVIKCNLLLNWLWARVFPHCST